MPPDLPVQPISPVASTAPPPPAAEQRAAPEIPLAVASARAFPNPSLRLDPRLGMVVLEFRDNGGEITDSIPSQRILDAYRTHTEPVPGGKTAPEASKAADRNDASNERLV